MKNSKKRGFTIVELVIVIAVIAILAGVLIPTFTSIIKKANEASDTALIKSLNTSLKADEVLTSKPATMYDALQVVKNDGYDLTKIKATASGNEILWDSVNNCFVYLKDNQVTYIPDSYDVAQSGVALWKIVAASEELSETYSNYLADGRTGPIEAKTGVDVGENTGIAAITLETTADTTLVVRTNSSATALTVKAPNATVKHFEAVGTVKVVAVDRVASYHEFGQANTVIVNDGHIVVESAATVDNIIVEKSTASDAEVSVDNKGEVATVAGADSTVTISGVATEKIIATTSTTLTAAGGYVKLSDNQTITTTVQISNDTILDLNGKTISIESSAKTGIYVKKGTLTIIDSVGTGKIDASSTIAVYVFGNGGNATVIMNGGEIIAPMSDGYAVFVGNENKTKEYSSTLILNSGKISGDYAICVFGQNSKCYINGGEVITEGNCAISGNGKEIYAGTYIEINGGTIKSSSSLSDACAIYLPQYGTTVINGGYIEGHDCINIKSGLLTINGGEFVATGVFDESLETNNGAVSTGSAITISSSSSYSGKISVQINNGTFKSAHGYAIAEIIPELTSGGLAAADTCVNYIQFNGGDYVHGDKVSKSIYIAYAYEKITWTGIDSSIIEIKK